MPTLTKTRLYAGVWEGVLTDAGTETPRLRVTHLGAPIEGVAVTEAKDVKGWLVHVPVPVHTSPLHHRSGPGRRMAEVGRVIPTAVPSTHLRPYGTPQRPVCGRMA